MDIAARVGQVWALNDGDTIELIVQGEYIAGRINEVRWTTVVLRSTDGHPGDPFINVHPPGTIDHVGESAFVNAERGDVHGYENWLRIM